MHIKVTFIITFPLMIPYLLAAPIYDGSWRPLIVARTVVVPVSAHVAPTTIQSNRLTSPTFGSAKATSQFRVPTSAVEAASRFSKSKLTAQLTTASRNTHPRPLAIGGGAPCPNGKRGVGSTGCLANSGSSSETESEAVPYDKPGTELRLHPDGAYGPHTRITKSVILGKPIGQGAWGAVHEIESHGLHHQGDVVAKKMFTPPIFNQAEVDNIRKVGQLRASGTHDGHTWVVMDKAKGKHMMDTEAYKKAAAEGPDAVAALTTHAHGLVGNARFYHASYHGLVHDDLYHDNIKYEEDENHQLVKAHLLDWGGAVEAPPKDANGNFSPQHEAAIRQLYPASAIQPEGSFDDW